MWSHLSGVASLADVAVGVASPVVGVVSFVGKVWLLNIPWLGQYALVCA